MRVNSKWRNEKSSRKKEEKSYEGISVTIFLQIQKGNDCVTISTDPENQIVERRETSITWMRNDSTEGSNGANDKINDICIHARWINDPGKDPTTDKWIHWHWNRGGKQLRMLWLAMAWSCNVFREKKSSEEEKRFLPWKQPFQYAHSLEMSTRGYPHASRNQVSMKKRNLPMGIEKPSKDML